MKAHEIWKAGWLRDKPYCRNPKHEWFNPIIDNLVRDLNRGENRIILVVGTPRSGKSSFSLWLQCYMNWCYFGRSEYAPASENIIPLNDVYWKVDDFIEATKDPSNMNKFLTMEEQGAEQYKMDFLNKSSGLQAFDKLQQIFGVDKRLDVCPIQTS
jgi:hypothetical protein